MEATPEPLPCPCCGFAGSPRNPLLKQSATGYPSFWINCSRCGVGTAVGVLETVLATWNRRPQ